MRTRILLNPLALLLLLAIYLAAGWTARGLSLRPLSGDLRVTDPALASGMQAFPAGEFEVRLIATGQGHPGGYQGARLAVVHRSAPGHWLWYTRRGEAFVAAAQGVEKVEEDRGSFFITDRLTRRCAEQTIDRIDVAGEQVTVAGQLTCRPGGSTTYSLAFTPAGSRQLAFQLSFGDPALNRSYLTYASDPDEHFFGFGEQFSNFDHKGQRVPVWVSEQGIGRGLQPLTFLVDRVARSGGGPYTTYAAVPHYLTSRLRSLFLENKQYSVFDLRRPERVQVQVFSPALSGRILSGGSPEELIAAYTEWAGRMRRLPDWILEGAVVGMQGGTEIVRQVYETLKKNGTPLAAFWLQDWVGQRTTSFGKQLWWNWELDQHRYPGWDALRQELEGDGVRVMVYASPFLADVSAKPNVRRRLFQEALEAGYLVLDEDGQPYLIQNTDFAAGLVDLANPEAWAWYQDVLRRQLVEEAGAAGWMADFGEALPYDSVLAGDQPGAGLHNEYPELWARLNRELVDSLPGGEGLVFFNRAAFQRSPAYSTLFWEGDQLVSWDEHDGIKSAVTGLLSGGVSGLSLNHSDIGGYTAIANPLARRTRSKELLLRWMELSAFTTIFRTHEGNLPEENVQFYTDEDTLAHFSRMARVYQAWAPLRKKLVDEAARNGMPVARHLFLHYPDDPVVYRLSYQEYLLGSSLLVAPVLDPGREAVRVYLPPGNWVHLWTGRIYRTPYEGSWVTIPAPLGWPGVFYQEGSPDGIALRQNLLRGGLVEP
jgi:alpha-glucosidase